MELKELLELKPGELIKGITIERNGIWTTPNKDGWSNLSRVQESSPSVSLLAASEINMARLMNDFHFKVIKNISDISLYDVLKNSNDFQPYFYGINKPYKIRKSQIIGMNLGETILLFRPLFGTKQTKEPRELNLYQHILASHGPCWLKMTTSPIYFNISQNIFGSDLGELHLFLTD